MSNMRIWDAVSKTDPSHTKKVEYGRKFTSIDAHWQIKRATETFGPIGEGWGYTVEHSTLTLTPEMILAVADVKIWWASKAEQSGQMATMGEVRVIRSYGPIRATCEMYGPKTKFGKPVVPPEFVTDEDAPKKAMTDALTKGLSHLGFSADVFLGLYDDNRYVQKMTKEFAEADKLPTCRTPCPQGCAHPIRKANFSPPTPSRLPRRPRTGPTLPSRSSTTATWNRRKTGNALPTRFPRARRSPR